MELAVPRSRKDKGGGWSIFASNADRSAAREAFALERQSRMKWAKLLNEQRDRDHQAQLVGAALRRAAREAAKTSRRMIRVSVRRLAWQRDSGRRCQRIEVMTGLAVRGPTHVGADGRSSFHFKWRSRGVGDRRSKRDRVYRSGEAVRHLRYILRLDAREIAAGGVVTNISDDLSVVAGVMEALEQLAYDDRANSTVYVSIVIALPHELNDDDRTRCLRNICSRFDDEQLPFVAVLHDPDPRGDDRNNHAHLMVGLRPFGRDEAGRFSFAAGQSSDLNDKSWIWPMRCHIADCLNRAMIEAGEARRFTPLSNAARGLPQSPGRGKDTPGQKHRQRRARDIAEMKTELYHRAERQRVLEDIRTRAVSIAGALVHDLEARLETARKLVAERLSGRRLEVGVVSGRVGIAPAGVAGQGIATGSAEEVGAEPFTGGAATPPVEAPAVATSQPAPSARDEGRGVERLSSTGSADLPATIDDHPADGADKDRDRERAEAVFDRWPILPFDWPRRRNEKASARSRQLAFSADDLANDPEIVVAMRIARTIDMKPYLVRRWTEFLAAVEQDLSAGRIDTKGRSVGPQVDRGPYYRGTLGKLIDHPDVRDAMMVVQRERHASAELLRINERGTALGPVLAIARGEIGRTLLADDRRRLTADLDRLAQLAASGSFLPVWNGGLRLQASSVAIADEVAYLAIRPEVRHWLEMMATALGSLRTGPKDMPVDRPAPAVDDVQVGLPVSRGKGIGA